jgi:hypothetical protein
MPMMMASVWGQPRSRFYGLVRRVEASTRRRLSACVVGCSDGKFVLPLLRRGYAVAAYDIDAVALFGTKIFPLPRRNVARQPYVSFEHAESFPVLPSETRRVAGFEERAKAAGVDALAAIRHQDFYHRPPGGQFDLVFTSCSMQYKNNQDLPVAAVLRILQDHVIRGGHLAIEYMLPLEDGHTWKAPHFLRTGQMRSFFSPADWSVVSCREARHPLFEAGHVDRPQDHYHRFGYILARRRTGNE